MAERYFEVRSAIGRNGENLGVFAKEFIRNGGEVKETGKIVCGDPWVVKAIGMEFKLASDIRAEHREIFESNSLTLDNT